MPLSYNLNEIDQAVDYILKNAKNKTLLFYGEMGAGKTTLIRALVKALGSEDLAASPTFSLVNEYNSKEGTIYHFDFYRIENENEALDMGIEDYFDSPGWKLIEWPQKIANLLEPQWQKIELEIKNENSRVLNIC
ncbi:tRNA (adenosine(37)-N6)-threonylcarbamoyltransferase complex ATPase subunit type 1 TsaE [Salegentibacter sp. F14]